MAKSWKAKFALNVVLSLVFGAAWGIPVAAILAAITAPNPLASFFLGMILGGVLPAGFFCACFWFLEVRNV